MSAIERFHCSTLYTEDRHELRVTGTKCRLPDTMSGTDEIFISGAAYNRKVGHLLGCDIIKVIGVKTEDCIVGHEEGVKNIVCWSKIPFERLLYIIINCIHKFEWIQKVIWRLPWQIHMKIVTFEKSRYWHLPECSHHYGPILSRPLFI